MWGDPGKLFLGRGLSRRREACCWAHGVIVRSLTWPEPLGVRALQLSARVPIGNRGSTVGAVR
jgi:hypothetical protein